MSSCYYPPLLAPSFSQGLSTSSSSVILSPPPHDLEETSSAIWKCIKIKQNETGGYTYKFKCRSEYDCTSFEFDKIEAARTRWLEIRPAIEPFPTDLAYLDPKLNQNEAEVLRQMSKTSFYVVTSSLQERKALLKTDPLFSEITLRKYQEGIKKNRHKRITYRETLQYLGFIRKSKNCESYLKLPDRETLISRWNILRITKPELPPLSILSSENIADDRTFTLAFITHSFVLSERKERIHDIHAHALPILSYMLTEGYTEEKERLKNLISNCLAKIDLAKSEIAAGRLKLPPSKIPGIYDFTVLEAGLSAIVDSIATYEDTKHFHSGIEDKLLGPMGVWISPYFTDYLQKRFPEYVSDEYPHPSGAYLWELIKNLKPQPEPQSMCSIV